MREFYRPKNIDCTFVVLAPDGNPSLLKSTVASVRCNYGNPCLAVAPELSHADQLAECERVGPLVLGGDTVTSLVNAGLRAATTEWSVLAISGVWARPGLIRRYSCFIKDRFDVLYPVGFGRSEFTTSSLNGLMIHNRTFAEVGDFATQVSFDLCRLLWASDAVDRGCRFQGMAGAKFF